MALLDLLPAGVKDLPLFSLSALDLLQYVEQRNPEDDFWREKLRLEFPERPIIDPENLNLVYWYYVYKRNEDEISSFFKQNSGSIREARDQSLSSKAIMELINKLSESGQKLIFLEELKEKLSAYISDIRSKKYGTWPKRHDMNDPDLDQELDVRFNGAGRYIVRVGDKQQDLNSININLYPVKFNAANEAQRAIVLAYIYLQPTFETFLNFNYDYAAGINTGGAVNFVQTLAIPGGATHITATIGGGGGGGSYGDTMIQYF